MNGEVVHDASDDPGGELRLRSGGAASAASADLGAELLLRNDGLCFCAFGGASLMTKSELGHVASAGASL